MIAGVVDADPEALIGLLGHERVRFVAQEVVAPHLVGTPRVVHAGVEDPVGSGPGPAGADPGDGAVEGFTGGQIGDPQVITLVP